MNLGDIYGEYQRLREAVKAVYYAGHWHCDREVDEQRLWTELRDAANLEPGQSPQEIVRTHTERLLATSRSTVAPVEGNLTTDRNTPGVGVPKANGQNEKYVVLSESERAKGFVRPVRHSYRHVGIPGPQYPLRDLSDEQRKRFAAVGYVKFEPYPEGSHGSALGRYWTQAQLDSIGKGCGTVTSMSTAIAETYARSPGFYGSTFCCGCRVHLPVGKDGEFTWDDDPRERVGT